MINVIRLLCLVQTTRGPDLTAHYHWTLRSLRPTRMDCIPNQPITAITELNILLISLFHPPPLPSSSWSCLQLRWRLCLQSSVQTQVLNSAGVAVCLPAYILIYLRALNWTSYSFGLRWSHGSEGSSVTLRHAGNTGLQRRAAHAASCLKCAAETARHK